METAEEFAPDVTRLLYSAVYSPFSLGAVFSQTSKLSILVIKEVAEYLQVIGRTIYRLADTRKTPPLKVGGSWLFPSTATERCTRRDNAEASDQHGTL